jgi:hypothetical protein
MWLAKEKDMIFEPRDLPGPTALGKGRGDDTIKMLASQIIARYTQTGAKGIKILVRDIFQNRTEILSADSIEENYLKELRL